MTQLYTTAFPYVLTTTLIIGGYLVYKYWPTVKRIITGTLALSTVLTIGYFVARGPEVVIQEKIVKVYEEPDRQAAYQEALSEVPQKYGIHPLIVETLQDKESANRDLDAVKTEFHKPTQIAMAAKFTKDKEKQKLIATSYCPWQVMGYEAEQRGVPYWKLHDPRVCVEIGAAVWKTKEESCKKQGVSGHYELIKCTAKNYNGSGYDAQVYTDDFMNKLSAKAFRVAFSN